MSRPNGFLRTQYSCVVWSLQPSMNAVIQGVDEFEQPLRVRVVGTGRGLLSYGIDVVLPVRGVGVLPRCRCFAFRWLLALYRR